MNFRICIKIAAADVLLMLLLTLAALNTVTYYIMLFLLREKLANIYTIKVQSQKTNQLVYYK